VVIGATGSGKTETVLRIARGAVADLGWRVYYIDAKGDPRTMDRFAAAMQAAGAGRIKTFPTAPYDGWRGDPLALLNRLMAVEDFTEPYYRAVTKVMLLEAVTSPLGPPAGSEDLLDRLKSDTTREGKGTWARYRAFFGVLDGQLDGSWAYEDADAAYLLLKGVSLHEEAAGLGRFLVEDFAHFVSQRKKPEVRVLLIIDEFSALSAQADAANLFERVRSLGAAIVVTSQSYGGLGAAADRILDAAGGLICHQCPDPERLAERAGSRRVVESTLQIDTASGPTGLGSLRKQDVYRVHPDRIRQLDVGEAYVISGGRAARVSVTPIGQDELAT
jgi:hypothetical protein